MSRNNTKQVAEIVPFTDEQERANTIIHAAGLLLGFIGVPILINIAIKNNETNGIIGSCIYSASFLLLFTISTWYHACKQQQRKCRLEKLDYISIYFLIAGTYTPFLLKFMPNTSGIILLCLVWACALAGTLQKLFSASQNSLLTVGFYLFAGLLFLFKCQAFFASMPYSVGALVIAGIVLYITGIIFFLWQKWYYHHAIWHAFVLTASACHYTAVLLSVNTA